MNDELEINYLQYPIFSVSELLSFKKHPQVNFEDYNFDDFPDIAIHNKEASGMKNQVYDIFLYLPNKKRYYRNRFLSKVTNPVLNSEEKTLSTFGAGGMASQIYSSSTYTWKNDRYEMIKSVNQSYIDSIDRFIRISKSLTDTTWTIKVDTLKDEELDR